jgi:hypothetical protein
MCGRFIFNIFGPINNKYRKNMGRVRRLLFAKAEGRECFFFIKRAWAAVDEQCGFTISTETGTKNI